MNGEPLLDAELLQLLHRLDIAMRRPASAGLRGERLSRRRGTGQEFLDRRAYVAGDDVRAVDWPLFARSERFFIRQFREEQARPVRFITDCSASMGFGQPAKLRKALQLTLALAHIALTRGDAADIWLASAGPPSRLRETGRNAIFPLAQRLAQQQAAGIFRLDDCVRLILAQPDPGPLFILSDLLGVDSVEPPLRRLAGAGHHVVLIHTLAKEDVAPEPGGDWRLIDAETGATVEVSMTAEVIALYQQRLNSFLTRITALCGQTGTPLAVAGPDQTLADVLFGQLVRAGVLA